MNSNEFIISRIDYLIEKYPFLKCTYEFDEYSKSHFIEVLPRLFYTIDNQFQEDETNIIINFINDYPYETITFISDSDLYCIDKPMYIKTGDLFETKVTVYSNLQIDILINETRLIGYPKLLKKSKWEFPIKTIVNSLMTNPTVNLEVELLETKVSNEVEPAGNYQLALAA